MMENVNPYDKTLPNTLNQLEIVMIPVVILVIISAWKDKSNIIGTIQKKNNNPDNQNNTSNT